MGPSTAGDFLMLEASDYGAKRRFAGEPEGDTKKGWSERLQFAISQRSKVILFRGSSVVEQSAVNRSVVGSNPTRGATFPQLIEN